MWPVSTVVLWSSYSSPSPWVLLPTVFTRGLPHYSSFGSCASSSCKCQPSAKKHLLSSNCIGCPAGRRHLLQWKSCQLLWELSICPSFSCVKRKGGRVWVEQGGHPQSCGWERQTIESHLCSGCVSPQLSVFLPFCKMKVFIVTGVL